MPIFILCQSLVKLKVDTIGSNNDQKYLSIIYIYIIIDINMITAHNRNNITEQISSWVIQLVII